MNIKIVKIKEIITLMRILPILLLSDTNMVAIYSEKIKISNEVMEIIIGIKKVDFIIDLTKKISDIFLVTINANKKSTNNNFSAINTEILIKLSVYSDMRVRPIADNNKEHRPWKKPNLA